MFYDTEELKDKDKEMNPAIVEQPKAESPCIGAPHLAYPRYSLFNGHYAPPTSVDKAPIYKNDNCNQKQPYFSKVTYLQQDSESNSSEDDEQESDTGSRFVVENYLYGGNAAPIRVFDFYNVESLAELISLEPIGTGLKVSDTQDKDVDTSTSESDSEDLSEDESSDERPSMISI